MENQFLYGIERSRQIPPRKLHFLIDSGHFLNVNCLISKIKILKERNIRYTVKPIISWEFEGTVLVDTFLDCGKLLKYNKLTTRFSS